LFLSTDHTAITSLAQAGAHIAFAYQSFQLAAKTTNHCADALLAA